MIDADRVIGVESGGTETGREYIGESEKSSETSSRANLSPRSRSGITNRQRLRGAFQCDQRQMMPPRHVPDVQFEALPTAATDLRLRAGARRSPRPVSPRLESRLPTSGPPSVVDLVGRTCIERVVRPLFVEPTHVERQLSPKGIPPEGDQQLHRALVL